jgi:hypothetical protein
MLSIFKMRTNFGYLDIWDQIRAHSASIEAIEHAAAQRAENGALPEQILSSD